MWQCNCPNSTSGRLQGGHPTKYVYESPLSAMGQKAKYSSGADVFRFTPESGLKSDIAPWPFRASNGSHLVYSITSSARPSSEGGTVSPRALAVLRLITSSNLTGCSIGKSAGFSPFKTFCT